MNDKHQNTSEEESADSSAENAHAAGNDDTQSEHDFEEKYLRACADLENFRKQVERDKSDFAKFANENCLVALLPVLDNFKRAAAHLPEDLAKNEWVRGMTEIEKQFEGTLANLGLKKIEAKVGDALDANKHEAVATGDGESGKILEVLEDGYDLNGKILRAAKVRVGE